VTPAICLVFGAVLALPTDHVTLAWTHSVQKTEWQEDYRVENGRLVLSEARIAGSGAGMEPPAGAVLRGGIYHYRPALDPLPEVALAVSHFTAGYRLCWDGACHDIADLLGTPVEGTVTLRPCPG
jgi:hypothetical protein